MTIKFLVQIIVWYIFASCLVWLIANKSIFVPPKSTYQDSSEIIKLDANGKQISAIYLHSPQDKFVIIYSHGNAEDLGVNRPLLQEIHRWGVSVIGYDYHGYGTSQGWPSENATYKDINAVYEYLITDQKINPSQIILYGRSLGTGPSVELAAKKPVGALILESPFVSAYRVVTHYPIFFPDKYNNLAKLKSIHVPILFIHGQNDTIIPIWHGKKLYASYTGPKQYYWVPDVGHNDINYFDPKHKKVILDFIASIET